MEVTLNAGDLLTVAGASAAGIILTQFAKALFKTSAEATRTIALLFGLILVVAATILTTETLTPLVIILAVIVGAQAGLATWSFFDVVRDGFDYVVAKRSDTD